MAMNTGAAWRAWSSYRGAGVATQAFLAARMAVAPLGPLAPYLRSLRGRVVSLGSGHGAVDRYIAELNPGVTIEGIELNAARVGAAGLTAHRSPRVSIRLGDARALDADEAYDGAVVIDLLHHIPADAHSQVARSLWMALKPGATCLVKEMALTPRRQYLWNRFHDRIVAGPDPIYCRDPDDLARVFHEAGFDIAEVRRLARLHIYPQYLVNAVKPAGGPGS